MSSTMRAATAVVFSLSLSLMLELPSQASASMNAMTYIGCFSSSTPMTDQGSYQYQTSGYCQEVCYNVSMPAMGLTSGSNCYCGSQLPAKSDKVDDSSCDTHCNGYGQENCGGTNFWSVYKTGEDDSVGYYGGSASSSSSSGSASSTQGSSTSSSTGSSTTNAPVLVTSEAPGKTVVITLSATDGATSTSSPQNKDHKSTNTAGIAAGVVVGVVAAAAIAGAVFFYLRNQRRKQIEEEYSKRVQAQDYSATTGGSSRGMSVRSANDSRLDPDAMMHRRLSDGSIADEQDYSRRILKVTNPDDGR